MALFWALGWPPCKNLESEPQLGGEARWVEQGALSLSHQTAVLGYVSSSGNLHTYDGEHHC